MGFFVRRAAAAVVLVFLVASGSVLLAQLAPGDYAAQFGRSPEQIAADRHRLGLDRPVLQQYATWLGRAVSLDLGESFQYQQPVSTLVRARAANTALLALAALVVSTAIGIPWGVATGSGRGPVARILRGASLILLSVPPLIGSLILVTIASRTGWLPVSGMGGPSHFIVPTLALALPVAAMLERLQSQSLRDALARSSCAAARARGIPEWRVVWHHGWRQSLAPVLAIYGVIVGSLFSGSFTVEVVTAWPGLGQLMLTALMARDTNLVAGCAAAGAVFLAASILASDTVHALTDPRTRLEPLR